MANTEELIWFMNDGRELVGKDVSGHLSAKMPILLQAIESAKKLDNHIRSELDQYEPTGNLINDTLDLCESLSHIEIYCEIFLNEYHCMKSEFDLI